MFSVFVQGCEAWTDNEFYKDKVTFSRLFAIEFKDKIDCNLPFLLPTVNNQVIFYLFMSKNLNFDSKCKDFYYLRHHEILIDS
jgi:hypothetical protein